MALFDLKNRKCRICSNIIPNKYEKHFEKVHPDRLYPQKSQDQDFELEPVNEIITKPNEENQDLDPEMPVLEIQDFAKIHSTPKKQEKSSESFKSPEVPKNTIIEINSEEILGLKNEEIIPNLNDPNLFPFLI